MRMGTILLAIALSIASLAASASSVRFGNRLITDGDSVGTVRQVAGSPDRIVTIENERGAAIGERWEYYRPDGSTILVTIRNSRVTEIEELH